MNNSYILDCSINTGDVIGSMISDSNGLYFVYSTFFAQLRLYYNCPA